MRGGVWSILVLGGRLVLRSRGPEWPMLPAREVRVGMGGVPEREIPRDKGEAWKACSLDGRMNMCTHKHLEK